MSIHDEVAFDKEGKAVPGGRFGETHRKVFVPLVILLVGLFGYGLGRLSGAGQRSPVEIRYDPNIMYHAEARAQAGSASLNIDQAASAKASTSQVYASSKGTKYYYAGCKNTISAANKISFSSARAAEQAGYTLASGCKP